MYFRNCFRFVSLKIILYLSKILCIFISFRKCRLPNGLKCTIVIKYLTGRTYCIRVTIYPYGIVIDFQPFYFSLITSGTSAKSDDIMGFIPLRNASGLCKMATPPVCTVLAVNEIPWDVESSTTYYMNIRAENTLGLESTANSRPMIQISCH